MALALTGLRYLTRFRCIAEACEDSCCVGWQVPVDRLSYLRQREILGGADESDAYARAVVVNERPTGDGDHAHITLRADGSCHFLDEQKLCSIQRRGGAGALGNACANYPRVISRIGERVETAGSLSCPEIARLCLLADDAMEMVPLDPALIPRPYASQNLAAPAGDPTVARFDQVRSTALQLLGDRRIPFRDRALALVWLGHTGSAPLSVSGDGTDPGVMLVVLLRLLQSRAALPTGRRFDALATSVLATHGLRADQAISDDAMAMRRYRSRCARVERAYGGEVDRAFSHYAMNFWITRWYTDHPSMAAYVHGLLLRLALLRVLLIGHPALDPVLMADRPDPAGRDVLHRVLVEVVQSFTKDMEHDRALLDQVGLGIAPAPRDLLDQSVALAAL